MPTIELVITGGQGQQLGMWADGQVELPRQPPFPALGDGKPAALITVDLLPESPRLIAMFNAWYLTGAMLPVLAGDGDRTWIEGMMRCARLDVHEGIQQIADWTPPLRRASSDAGLCLLYRPQPIWRPIAKDVHRYVLAAECYAWAAPPPEEVRRVKGTIH
jgi:hypothetical protein